MRTIRQVLKIIAVTALSAAFLVAITLGVAFWHFYRPPPKFSHDAAADALDAQRQDLHYFSQLIALDRAFTPDTRAEANRRVAELSRIDHVLDRAHFRIALMQIVALADNGHSKLGYDDAASPKELPVRVAPFIDGVYVMRAMATATDLLGGRIVAIDDTPIDEVMKRLQTLRGGPPQWRRAYAAVYLSDQDMLFGLDIAPNMNQSTWTVETPKGERITRTLDAYAPAADEGYAFVKRWLSSEPLAGLSAGWHSFKSESAPPLALRNFDQRFRRMRLDNSCVMYVEFKSNDDDGAQNIRDFVSQTTNEMQSDPPCELILDMRYDDGGNYLKTAYFMRHLPRYLAPKAHIYLLIGPSTFSAGIVSTAFVKQAGGDRVTLLGETVGDRLQFFSEGNRGCLPNYPLCVSYQTGKHDYQHSCLQLDICFWPNYFYPTRVASLDPDESIPLTFGAWRMGRDPVFERAVALAQRAQSERSVGQ